MVRYMSLIVNSQLEFCLYQSMILTTTSVFSAMVNHQYITRWCFQTFFIFTPNPGEMIPILTGAYFFKWVGSTTNQITIWESMFANQLFTQIESLAKDSSDLCRFGEGLRTSATRTPIRGDVTSRSVLLWRGGVTLVLGWTLESIKAGLTFSWWNCCLWQGMTHVASVVWCCLDSWNFVPPLFLFF